MKTSPIASSVLALGMFLALMLASAALGDETVLHGRFVRLHDGDTIWVSIAEKQVEIRLAICDAPEKEQAFGARAKEAMRDLILGKDIELGTPRD
jgi:micrococcal nuclease